MSTDLESLSNEILMQIFEYLDAYHLYKAFFHTNIRFIRLLTDHRLALKFHSKHIRENDEFDKNLWQIMANYLTAITFIHDRHIRMFMLMTKDSQFSYLHSLTFRQVRISRGMKIESSTLHLTFVFYDIEKSSVVKFLTKFKSLKNLRIQSIGENDQLTLMIFCSNELPNLLSYESKNREYPTVVIFTYPRKTNIEYLTVDCTLYNLSNILIQTPKLRYLNLDLTTYGQDDRTETQSPLPKMMFLTHLTLNIHFISYKHLTDLMKIFPLLKTLDLSGNSMGQHFDNGEQLKNLFAHLREIVIDELKCLTSATSKDQILSTFLNDIDGFWSDVSCSIEYDRALISAFGRKK